MLCTLYLSYNELTARFTFNRRLHTRGGVSVLVQQVRGEGILLDSWFGGRKYHGKEISYDTGIICAYQYYAPLPPVRAIVGQGGDLTNLNINCPNMRDIPYNQIPLQKVGDYWGFDTHSVTVQYTETIAVFKMSSEVIKCPTIGAASFGQSPYIARHLPVRGVVGHNIDRRIKSNRGTWPEMMHWLADIP